MNSEEPSPPAAPRNPLLGRLAGLDPGELLAMGLRTVRLSHGAQAWTPPTPEELAALLPQYGITALLGCGGMGAVYRGVQSALDRPVAIKLLSAELATDPQFIARFQREARTLAKLQHPGIVTVHDFGQTSAAHPYFVMEFVEGTDLQRILRAPGLNPEQALTLISQVCDALHYAHRQGVIHRDIKPANILVTADGRAKVADFGLSRPLAEDTFVLTSANAIMGTDAYMAPEQRTGQADARAEIYALGVMLYEMLTGQRPHGVFDPPSRKVRVDIRLDEVVLKALQEEPARRYQQAGEMKTDVDHIRTTPPPKPHVSDSAAGGYGTPKKKRGLYMVVAGMVAAAAIGMVAFFSFQTLTENDDSSPARQVQGESRVSIAGVEPRVLGDANEEWVDGLAAWWANPEHNAFNRENGNVARAQRSPSRMGAVALSAPLADQAARVTARGDAWGLDIRDEARTPDRGARAYSIQIKKNNPAATCGYASPNGSWSLIGTYPWPVGFDWNAAHTLEARIIGKFLSIFLDGRKLGEIADDRIARGNPVAWADKASMIEHFEYLDLGRSALSAKEAALGSPSAEPSRGPKQIGTDKDWKAVGKGDHHALAIKADGSLWAWGQNRFGELGIGDLEPQLRPVRIGGEKDWVKATAGANHSVALKSNGTLWAWGRSSDGALGYDTDIDHGSPRQIGEHRTWTTFVPMVWNTLAIRADGSLWGWGANHYYQLGDGTQKAHREPDQIGSDEDWIAAAGSYGHALALKSDRSLWGWGDNAYFQLGATLPRATTRPTRIGSDNDWMAIEARNPSSFALKKDRSLWACGRNRNGRLGTGSTAERQDWTRVGADRDWKEVSLASEQAFALKTDGSLWAWGKNDFGQLGDGTTTDQLIPVRVGTDTDWETLAASRYGCIAIKRDGSLWAWGLEF